MKTIDKPILCNGYGRFKNIVFQHFNYKDYIKFFKIKDIKTLLNFQ